MKTYKTREAGRLRVLMRVALAGAAMAVPMTAAIPAAAVPASTPGVVQTEYPGYDRHDRCERGYGWDDRGYGYDREYGWNDRGYGYDRGRDRGYDRCERGFDYGGSGGLNNLFPFGLFGSS
ncbi:hypothetical protein [Nocardia lijiangensis]|uniref:hypothetical protein n=1 Tax=Nocardia lijiangensis TaxID=299618 RepID=UPI0008300C04|nr:hypothetical protein [Nocardia lijiangensis]